MSSQKSLPLLTQHLGHRDANLDALILVTSSGHSGPQLPEAWRGFVTLEAVIVNHCDSSKCARKREQLATFNMMYRVKPFVLE